MVRFSIFAILAGLMLAACGGGGGGGGGSTNQGGAGSTPPSTLSVTLTPAAGTATVAIGSAANVTVTANVSGSASTPVVANLASDQAVFATANVSGGGTAYTITAATRVDLQPGIYTGSLTFRLCQESACSNIYPNTTATYAYTLTVSLPEWDTYQGNAAHTGFVPTTLDFTKYHQAWSWTEPGGLHVTSALPVKGSVYFSNQAATTFSLDGGTGAVNWSVQLGTPVSMISPGAAAYSNGVIYVPGYRDVSTTGEIRGLDAATGTYRSSALFATQLGEFNSPTIDGNEMFFASGLYGGDIAKYALPSGNLSWLQSVYYSDIFQDNTPAVDQKYVYHYNGIALFIYDRSTGSLVRTIGSTVGAYGGIDGPTGTVLAPSGHVIFADRQTERQIVAVDPLSGATVWRTSENGYHHQPVVAGGKVYVKHATTKWEVRGLDDADGQVLWIWDMPATDTQLIEDLVVFKNVLLVSSDKTLYAIDLASHQTVWTWPVHGRLSFSADGTLYVVTNDFGKVGSVTALKSAP